MRLEPHVSFDGQCEEAFEFYAKVLGGKIEALFRYTGTPVETQVPPEWREKIIHARLVVDGHDLMGSNSFGEHYRTPAGFSITLDVKEPAAAERIFRALAEGGKVTMPLQMTFWSPAFGMLTDRFGTPWMVNCEQAG